MDLKLALSMLKSLWGNEMMNKFLYYINYIILPVLYLVIFVNNWFKLTKQAFRFTNAEVKSAIVSNKRHFRIEK